MRFFVDGSITTPITEYLTNPKYQQVEYLESTGTQYIDTGLQIDDTCGYAIDCQKILSGDSIAIGVKGEGNSRWCYNSSNFNINLSWNDAFVAIQGQNYDRHQAYLNYKNDRKRVVDGIEYESISTNLSSNASQYTVCLFASKWGYNIPNLFWGGKIYSAQITKGSEIIAYFIPAIRKEDGKPGMYDKVSGQFFTNDGTDEFLYGNPVYNGVPRGYKECEYLESAGVQYIDTGFKPNPATTKIDCAFCALAGGSTQMFGVRTVAASNDANNTNICFGIAGSKIYIRGDWIRNHENLISDIELEEYIHLIAHNQTMYINDVEYAYDLAKNNTYLDYNFCLFACNTAGNISFYNKIRQYYFKIYDNGILVRDMIPVLREANNEAGMYDRVSNTFFTDSSGTGTFAYKLKERPTEKVTRIAYSGSKMRLVRNTAA